ncbi:hypothetical protein QLX08_009177 [Tetragonisca angustula]|uniref:Uncharacterized protein n=1 Tax=Tetragonisca angustula TaxID=166442 RepID=A0AAW0ZHF5_9HYME
MTRINAEYHLERQFPNGLFSSNANLWQEQEKRGDGRENGNDEEGQASQASDKGANTQILCTVVAILSFGEDAGTGYGATLCTRWVSPACKQITRDPSGLPASPVWLTAYRDILHFEEHALLV